MAPDSTRTFEIPGTLNVAGTISGTKMPLMIGPSEVRWSTRTPDGLATMEMERLSNTSMRAVAWGPGAEWMLETAPRLLGSDDDISSFKPEGKLRELWRRDPFLIGRTDRPWDAIVAGIFGQKVQVRNAVDSRRKLARKFGDPAPGPERNGRTTWVLPSPETVSTLTYSDFHQLGVERKRAEILIRTARELRRISNIHTHSPEQVKARLERIRGIGPWTTNMVTATSLGDADAVPVGDYHLPNTVAWCLAGEPRATDERMLELIEPYRGHRWRVLRLAKSSGSAPKYGPKLSFSDHGMFMGS